MVCKHCPVFDTVAVLSIHRQGKKHLANAKIRLEKLREDAELRQKREHLKYMEMLEGYSNQEDAPLLKITQQKTERALQGSTEVKKQCAEREKRPNNLPFFQSRKPLDLNLSSTKKGQAKGTESTGTLLNSEETKLNQHSKNTQTADAKKTGLSETLSNSKNSDATSQSTTNCPRSNQLAQTSATFSSGSSDLKKELSPKEKARREHFSRLRQAGWIMGLDGKWYKDENAEFDSDEDEPPLPP